MFSGLTDFNSPGIIESSLAMTGWDNRFLAKGVSNDSGNLCVFSHIVLDSSNYWADCGCHFGTPDDSLMG